MKLTDWQLLSEIARNAVLAGGVLIGSIWTYYKFVKGRLFSPKITLGIKVALNPIGGEETLVGCEVSLRNIGAIQLRPSKCTVSVNGHSISEGIVSETTVQQTQDVLAFSPADSAGEYYIDPGESSFRSVTFPVPSGVHLLNVQVMVEYNDIHRTARTFQVPLAGKTSQAEQEDPPTVSK